MNTSVLSLVRSSSFTLWNKIVTRPNLQIFSTMENKDLFKTKSNKRFSITNFCISSGLFQDFTEKFSLLIFYACFSYLIISTLWELVFGLSNSWTPTAWAFVFGQDNTLLNLNFLIKNRSILRTRHVVRVTIEERV